MLYSIEKRLPTVEVWAREVVECMHPECDFVVPIFNEGEREFATEEAKRHMLNFPTQKGALPHIVIWRPGRYVEL